jgi:hypothetical protein
MSDEVPEETVVRILQEEQGLEKPVARSLTIILNTAASYAEGDGLAANQLQSMSDEDIALVSDRLQDLGSELELRTYMDFVEFVSDPDTDSDELNEAIQSL